MLHLDLPRLFDHHLGHHGLHQGLSWGWSATIWLGHMLTESNHRKQPVQAWVRQAHETLEKVTGQTVCELDFTDDRLTLLRRRLSKPATWHALEHELGQRIIRVYELKPARVRLDATTVSGYHAGGAESLFQYEYSKDNPTLKQVKGMVAALSRADEEGGEGGGKGHIRYCTGYEMQFSEDGEIVSWNMPEDQPSEATGVATRGGLGRETKKITPL